MSFAPNRRRLLRGLASLPLVGGAVALQGNPTAVAEPFSLTLLERYRDWLALELGEAMIELAPLIHPQRPHYSVQVSQWRREWCAEKWLLNPDRDSERFARPPVEPPSGRATIVLSAVGCDWKPRT